MVSFICFLLERFLHCIGLLCLFGSFCSCSSLWRLLFPQPSPSHLPQLLLVSLRFGLYISFGPCGGLCICLSLLFGLYICLSLCGGLCICLSPLFGLTSASAFCVASASRSASSFSLAAFASASSAALVTASSWDLASAATSASLGSQPSVASIAPIASPCYVQHWLLLLLAIPPERGTCLCAAAVQQNLTPLPSTKSTLTSNSAPPLHAPRRRLHHQQSWTIDRGTKFFGFGAPKRRNAISTPNEVNCPGHKDNCN